MPASRQASSARLHQASAARRASIALPRNRSGAADGAHTNAMHAGGPSSEITLQQHRTFCGNSSADSPSLCREEREREHAFLASERARALLLCAGVHVACSLVRLRCVQSKALKSVELFASQAALFGTSKARFVIKPALPGAVENDSLLANTTQNSRVEEERKKEAHMRMHNLAPTFLQIQRDCFAVAAAQFARKRRSLSQTSSNSSCCCLFELTLCAT